MMPRIKNGELGWLGWGLPVEHVFGKSGRNDGNLPFALRAETATDTVRDVRISDGDVVCRADDGAFQLAIKPRHRAGPRGEPMRVAPRQRVIGHPGNPQGSGHSPAHEVRSWPWRDG